jgi:CzcA family heavy metal efflux pump
VKLLGFLRQHAAVVWLGTAVLCLLGIASAWQMPSGIYPEVEFPRVVVVARVGGSPPDLFLTSVTRPIEQVLTTVLGVQRIRSKTIRGATEISLQFAPGTDMWRALQLTESRMAEVRASLPPDTEVIVERVTTGSFPVVTFNVSGPVDPRELREVAEYVVRPTIGRVPGVGRVEVLGGDVREVEVILDPEAAASLYLTPAMVAERLRSGMGLRAVGRMDRDRQLVTILADALPREAKEIAQMPVLTTATGGIVTLGSIAEVIEGHEDRLVRIGGPAGAAVSVSVARLPGASTPGVVDGAVAAVRALGPNLPPGVTIEPVYDQATLVRESIASVRDAILVGIVLCGLAIGIFLRDLRAGLLAAMAVPLTLAITFLGMRVGNQTLNLMSLGGMAVAIGLVVDDAIVMVEAIAHHRDLGADPLTAAVRGTAELAPAVVGTTLTTVVVFIPLGFLEGVVGDFFRALAFTLSAAVLISLAVALVLVPLGAGRWLSGRPRSPDDPMTRWYERWVRRSASHRWVGVLALLGLLSGGALLAPHVGRGFLPSMDEGAFVLDYFLPAGTSLETTEHFARAIEAELKKTPEVKTFTRRTGAELGPAAATELSRGDIMVRLVPTRTRARSSARVIVDLRDRIATAYPEVRIEFVQVLQDVLNDLAGNPRPVEVKLFGPDYSRLFELGDRVAARLRGIPGLVDLYDGHERPQPDFRFAVRRDELARIGWSADQLATELESALKGTLVGAIRRFDRLLNVRVRYPDPVRFSAPHVLNLPLGTRDRVTTFRAVANLESTSSPSQLLHEALQPMVDITADHEDRDLGSIADEVERAVRGIDLPPGYRFALGGQVESQRATIRDLLAVAGLALLLVLTVLGAQFRRLRLSLLVVGAVPTAIVGALGALFVTGIPLNASSLMGCVLLVGLVVKNGVLLLEEAERRLDAGSSPATAVAEASQRRLRPIVMTTVATLAGLFPLALGVGAGAELQRPLAVAVIGGLSTATVATLGLMPAFATWILGGKGAKAEAPPA